jgi:hypothetical protein
MVSCNVPLQVAFADKILLNKIDLVTEEEKKEVTRRIKVLGQAAAKPETSVQLASGRATSQAAVLCHPAPLPPPLKRRTCPGRPRPAPTAGHQPHERGD